MREREREGAVGEVVNVALGFGNPTSPVQSMIIRMPGKKEQRGVYMITVFLWCIVAEAPLYLFRNVV